jgi:DNA polymerase III subunit epsilon
MDFVALDVETANPDLCSICQIGVVVFSGGKSIDAWQSLVNPEDEFDEVNISVHGITENIVANAPTFPMIADHLRSVLSQKVVATHTTFDRTAITNVFEKYELSSIDCTWLDTARVARRAWPKYASSGYGLKNIANDLGIQFEHHQAREDARVAGEILLHAIAHTGITLDDWLVRVKMPISSASSSKVAREGNPDGPLAGEVIVFTGALSIPRKQAAELAAQAGCDVKDSINKNVTLLVVGDQDIKKLAGREKSSKHRKAEELISNGQAIRILQESDFIRIVNQ